MKNILINILLILFMINDFESSKNPLIHDSRETEYTINTEQTPNIINTEEKQEMKIEDPKVLPPTVNEESEISREVLPTVNMEAKHQSKIEEPKILPSVVAGEIELTKGIQPLQSTINAEAKVESKLADPEILSQATGDGIERISDIPPLPVYGKEEEDLAKKLYEYKQSSRNDRDFDLEDVSKRRPIKRSLSANSAAITGYQQVDRLQKHSKPFIPGYTFANRLLSNNSLRYSTNITNPVAMLGKSSMQPTISKLSVQQIINRSSSVRPLPGKVSLQQSATVEDLSTQIAVQYLTLKGLNQGDIPNILTLETEQIEINEINTGEIITVQLISLLNKKLFNVLEKTRQTLEGRRQIQSTPNQTPHSITDEDTDTSDQTHAHDTDTSSSRVSLQENQETWTNEQPYTPNSTLSQDENDVTVYANAVRTWLQLSLSDQLMYNVLSIDGGGVRGIVACKLIEEIEEKKLEAFQSTNAQHTVRLQDFFNVYTGTSIGGIIAIGLLLQDSQGNFLYHPSELKNILINNASVIFHKNFFRSLMQLFKPRYSNNNLKLLIETMILGNHTEHELKKAGIKYNFPRYNANNNTNNSNQSDSILDRKNVINNLSDIKRSTKNIRLIIPSYDIQNKKILIFDSEMVNKNATTGGDETAGKDFSLVDICMATSAAPLYFPTYPVTPLNDNTARYNCVDGGLFLNFPASATISKLIDHCMVKPQIYTVSITTGSAGDVTENNKEKHRGLVNWLQNGLIHIMRSSPTQLAENIVNNCVKDHIRLCVRLETSSKEMDDSRWSNLSRLINDTANYIARHKKNLFQRIVNELPLISSHINLNPVNPGNKSYPMLGNGKIAPALSQYSAIGVPFVSNDINSIAYNPENRVYNGAYVILPPISPALNYHSQETEETGDDDESRVVLDMRDI